MIKLILLSALFVVASAHAAESKYVVAKDLVSADMTGPHRGIAQHQIGFKNGAVVPAYKADCTLTLRPGVLAQLPQREELRPTAPFAVQQIERENCLSWGTSSGGDDVCEKHGEPFVDQLLTGELERNNGEKVAVFCRAYDEVDPRAAEQLWSSAIQGLLLNLL